MKRLGVSLVGFLSLAGAIAACDGDDDIVDNTADSGSGGLGDATVSSSSSGSVTSSSSGYVEPDSGPTETTPLLLSNDLLTVEDPAVRICFLVSSTSDAPTLDDILDGPPLPQDGLGIGITSVNVPAELEGSAIRPIVLYKKSLDAFSLNDKNCAELRAELSFAEKRAYPEGEEEGELIPAQFDNGTEGLLLEGADFDLGEVIPRGTYGAGRRHLLLVTGCPLSTTSTAVEDENCGVNFQQGTTSDFHAFAYDLDPAAATAGNSRIQYVYGSWTAYREFTDQLGSSSTWARLTYSETDARVIAEDVAFREQPARVESIEVPSLATVLSFGTSPLPEEDVFFNDEAVAVLEASQLTEVLPEKSYLLMSIGDPSVPPGGNNYRHILVPVD